MRICSLVLKRLGVNYNVKLFKCVWVKGDDENLSIGGMVQMVITFGTVNSGIDLQILGL